MMNASSTSAVLFTSILLALTWNFVKDFSIVEFVKRDREMPISKVDTRNSIALVWLMRYACPQPYHPSKYQAIMDSSFGLVRLHPNGTVDTFPGGFLQTPLSNSSKLQMR